jgi:hypothetical protein
MSITFHCPDAPTRLVRPDPAEPELQEERSTLPSLNLSQDNAFTFLRLMGLPEQSEGCVEAAALPGVSQKLLRVVNSQSARAKEYVPRSDSQQPRKARVIELGLGDEYLQRRATQFMELFAQARKHNLRVIWS